MYLKKKPYPCINMLISLREKTYSSCNMKHTLREKLYIYIYICLYVNVSKEETISMH